MRGANGDLGNGSGELRGAGILPAVLPCAPVAENRRRDAGATKLCKVEHKPW